MYKDDWHLKTSYFTVNFFSEPEIFEDFNKGFEIPTLSHRVIGTRVCSCFDIQGVKKVMDPLILTFSPLLELLRLCLRPLLHMYTSTSNLLLLGFVSWYLKISKIGQKMDLKGLYWGPLLIYHPVQVISSLWISSVIFWLLRSWKQSSKDNSR